VEDHPNLQTTQTDPMVQWLWLPRLLTQRFRVRIPGKVWFFIEKMSGQRCNLESCKRLRWNYIQWYNIGITPILQLRPIPQGPESSIRRMFKSIENRYKISQVQVLCQRCYATNWGPQAVVWGQTHESHRRAIPLFLDILNNSIQSENMSPGHSS
jgi:hypothetical protein